VATGVYFFGGVTDQKHPRKQIASHCWKLDASFAEFAVSDLVVGAGLHLAAPEMHTSMQLGSRGNFNRRGVSVERVRTFTQSTQ
jgi:hypothetical protein